MTTVALIVAAGKGLRAGGSLPKQYVSIAGKSVLRHTILAFQNNKDVDAIVVVIDPIHQIFFDAATKGIDITAVVHGGATRQESVRKGLEALSDLAPDIVLIHDAARALVSDQIISACVAKVKETGCGAFPAIAVADSLMQQDTSGRLSAVPRDALLRVQTPQAFPYQLILSQHRQFADKDFTDDSSLSEAAGTKQHAVKGDENNFKITLPEDFERAQQILEYRNMTQVETRTGLGFDVHRFCDGDGVMLGGIKIPYHLALKGHSDADVALHAITDALLGAISAGDIGDHFPPTDPRWKGASSDQFLSHATKLVTDCGAQICHIDLVVMCEAPKLSPHKIAMRQKIADIIGIEVDRVSVKATTTEKLGFTGRGEGIAAQAIATIRKDVR